MTKRLIIILGYTLNSECQIQPILQSRLDAALQIYQPEDKILVCGRRPPKSLTPSRCEVLTEAEAMKQHLIHNGIREENIVKEEKSTTTFGNAFYGLHLIKKESPAEIVIIANEFHYPVIKYSFTKVLGNNYSHDYHIIPDASLNTSLKEIQKWREIGQRMIDNLFPLLFKDVEDGDIKTLTSIIAGPVNPKFEQYVRNLLNLDRSVDIRDFICGVNE